VSELVRCARAIVGGEERHDYAFVIDGDAIADAGDFKSVHDRHESAQTRAFPSDRLVLPGLVNGHSHAYQILLRGWADDLPFERWRDEALYRIIPRLAPEDVYWIFVAAFSEMLAAGITTVAEFFYLNGRGNAHAEAAIRAAQHTGVRLVLARTWMDNPRAPEAFRENANVAAERTRALRAAHPEASVCVAPHSLHGASPEMIRAAVAFAEEEGCDLHIHVAERREPAAQISTLERLGALGAHTIAVHAIHASEEEKALLAQRGVRVICNPTTNLYLGDGVTDVAGLRKRGVTLGLGTDANVKPSIIGEMRAASYLQKLVRLDGAALGARAAYEMATSNGARALGLRAGDLIPGNKADFVVLSAAGVDPWSAAINGVVYRAEDAWVQATIVAGRRVYAGGASPIALEARREVGAIARRLGC
jgi:5-methylthioadenosine/S-adenosylhomocysteine deaminase